MKASKHTTGFALATLATLLALPAAAQAPAEGSDYQPVVGQEGKDVIWVPTSEALVERMLDLAKAKPGEFLMDLGSGDGRTVIAAAKRGLTALGIEYEPEMVELSKRNARAAGVESQARFEKADLYETDLSRAQVITLFLLPSINERLRPRLLDLAPGTRIVSNTFPMGDWPPDDRSDLPAPCTTWCTALLWVVPAKVHGQWQLGDERLEIEQKYQTFTGRLGGRPVTEGYLRGNEVSFRVGDVRHVGTVEGEQMRGQRLASSAGQGEWSARRR